MVGNLKRTVPCPQEHTHPMIIIPKALEIIQIKHLKSLALRHCHKHELMSHSKQAGK